MARILAAARTHWRDPLYRNGYLLMMNSVTGALFGFAFWLVAARTFDDAAVGYGAAVISAMTLLALLGKFGVDAALVRFVPHARREARARLVGVAVATAAVATLVLAAVFVVAAPALVADLGTLAANPVEGLLFIVFAIAIAVAWVFDAYFVAERSAQYSLYRNLLFNVVKVALPFLALFQATAFGIPAAWGAGVAASVALSIAFTPRLLRRAAGTLDAPSRSTFYRYSSLNYAPNVSEFLPGLLLPLLVLTIAGREANAYFYVAWTLAFMAFLASRSIAQSAFAEMTHDVTGVSQHLKKAGWQNALILLPFALGALFLGRPVLGLYGPAYAENAYPLLVIFAFSTGFLAVNALYLTLLKARRATLELVIIPLITLTLTFLIAYPLLVTRGLEGVGVAWFTANGLVALYSATRLATAPRRFDPDHDTANDDPPASVDARPQRDLAHQG